MSSNGKPGGTMLAPHPAGYELTVKRPTHPGQTQREARTTGQPSGSGALLAIWVLWSLVMFCAGVLVALTGVWVP